MKKLLILFMGLTLAFIGNSQQDRGGEKMIVSEWNGKNANWIGDSITEGTTRYHSTVASELALSLSRDYGDGGSSLARRTEILDTDYPPIIDRWQEMDDDADIVFMMIGTNDYSSQVPLGATDSTSYSEFNGCLNTVLPGLKAKYPNKLIIISTILSRANDDVYSSTVEDFNNAIRNKAFEYDLPIFESTLESELDLKQDYNSGTKLYTDDGLHPNTQGSIILGEALASYIDSFTPYAFENLNKAKLVVNQNNTITNVKIVTNRGGEIKEIETLYSK